MFRVSAVICMWFCLLVCIRYDMGDGVTMEKRALTPPPGYLTLTGLVILSIVNLGIWAFYQIDKWQTRRNNRIIATPPVTEGKIPKDKEELCRELKAPRLMQFVYNQEHDKERLQFAEKQKLPIEKKDQ
jgi:hypothetical protein